MLVLTAFMFLNFANGLKMSQTFSETKVEGRIQKGDTAAATDFLYLVGISLKKQKSTKFCGGSIIDEKYILTAAHCTRDAKSAIVFVGCNYIKGGTKYVVESHNIFTHEGYRADPAVNDIALIKVPKLKNFDNINSVRLPINSILKYENEPVIASGWGFDNDDDFTLSNQLKWAQFKVLEEKSCKNTGLMKIFDSHLCISSSSSIGEGDSGGPIILKGSGPNPIQIGLVSYVAENFDGHGTSAVCTRISSYLDWISKTIRFNEI